MTNQYEQVLTQSQEWNSVEAANNQEWQMVQVSNNDEWYQQQVKQNKEWYQQQVKQNEEWYQQQVIQHQKAQQESEDMVGVFIVLGIVGVIVKVAISLASLGGGKEKAKTYSSIKKNANWQQQLFVDEMNRDMQRNLDEVNCELQRSTDEMNREQQRHFAEDSMKSVTPFELGGWEMNQGNSFNLFSDNGFGGGGCGLF